MGWELLETGGWVMIVGAALAAAVANRLIPLLPAGIRETVLTSLFDASLLVIAMIAAVDKADGVGALSSIDMIYHTGLHAANERKYYL